MRGVLLGALLATAVLAMAVVDRDSGLLAWLRVRHDLAESQARAGKLRAEVDGLEGRVAALRDDPFAEERAIREVLGLARPGEVILRFHDEDGLGAEVSGAPVPAGNRSRR